MVLKVVRGKILKTLKLRWRPNSGPTLIVKDPIDYLIDNAYTSMLAQVESWVKSKTVRPADPVAIWDCRPHPFRTEREKGWDTRVLPD